MRGVTFENDEDLKNLVDNNFASRQGDFWRKWFDKLVKRWQEVVNNDEKYIITLVLFA